MQRKAWTLWLPLGLFAVFIGFVAVQLADPASTEVESAMIGNPLPQFALEAAVPDRPGLATADLRDGKPRLMNIFASWCAPCAVEAPQLAELQRRGVEIVGVDVRDQPEDIAAFLAQYGNPFSRIGKDDISAVQLSLGSSGVPETFVVDGQGVIRYQHVGDIRDGDVAVLLDKLREAGA
jgi:cytochrome c biogenesis protein CcmG/thiol:disulfide interchange protein DsbE